jgi:O-6-methylguanine DNA methyltransferase
LVVEESFETERLTLGGMTREDIPVLVEELNQPTVGRYLASPYPYTQQDGEEWVKNVVDSRKNGTEAIFGLRLKGESKLIGSVTLRQSGVLGFWIARDCRGKGFMPEAVGFLVDLARERFKQAEAEGRPELQQICGSAFPDVLEWDGLFQNVGSAQVARKVGFRFAETQEFTGRADVPGGVAKYLPFSNKRNVARLELGKERADAGANAKWPAFVTYAAEYATQIEDYYDSGLKAFDPDPVELLSKVKLTDFGRSVLLETAKIPYGETRTYSDIAAAVGRPEAVRSVGSALAGNPFPILIPCHRVLPKGGTREDPGNYYLGTDAKRNMLKIEQKLL